MSDEELRAMMKVLSEAAGRWDEYMAAMGDIGRLRLENRCNPSVLEYAGQRLIRAEANLKESINRLKEME